MRHQLKLFVLRFINRHRNALIYKYYSKQFKSYLKMHGIEWNKKVAGEDSYIKKWQQLSARVEPYSYRFFSRYCGETPCIIPEDIGHTVIEKILNPIEYQILYEDKNMFPVIVGANNLPRTILFRVGGGKIRFDGGILSESRYLADVIRGETSALILKPTVGSCSGNGIVKFQRERERYYDVKTHEELTYDYLWRYNNDFVLQEAIEQSEEMSRLNPTSINTIRLAIYRSVRTEEVVVTAGIVRVGAKGSFVDNAHAGGKFVGINIQDGTLGDVTLDQFGNQEYVWNGIDYSKIHFVVPEWDKVIRFAKSIGDKILHHRLIALDIALDKHNEPRLIEYNISGFSFWLFMYTNQLPLGEYTDEVIAYCKAQLGKKK